MDDSFLIKQIIAGNNNAFRLLILRYERPLFSFLRRYGCNQEDIEDIAQETFLKAHSNLKTYDSSKGASFSTWLFTIAKNLSLDSARKAKRQFQANIAPYFRDLESDGVEAKLIKLEEHSALCSAMQKLPKEFRSAVAMSWLQELTLEEIAKVENCAIGTVKSRIFRGKQMLANFLGASKGGLINESKP